RASRAASLFHRPGRGPLQRRLPNRESRSSFLPFPRACSGRNSLEQHAEGGLEPLFQVLTRATQPDRHGAQQHELEHPGDVPGAHVLTDLATRLTLAKQRLEDVKSPAAMF